MNDVDIVGIGDHLIEYPKIDESKFENTEEYLIIAKKIIRTFAPRFRTGLAEEMLRSDDAISNVATAIMMADWRWNPEHKAPSGKIRSRYCYRNQCGIWAVQGYIARQKSNGERKIVSLDTLINRFESDTQLHEILPDVTQSSPEDDLIKEEHKNFVINKISDMLTTGLLTEHQAKFIKMHYLDRKTFVNIGKEHNVSREAVRQTVERGMNNIRKEFYHE